jgi:glycosyltransferase involved in cell wall biosynthesis
MYSNSLISICIPSYNAENFIKETLESVLNQTYRNIEVVITDDCSKDSTVSVIHSLNDERIKFYQNEKNLGVEGNWNKALQLGKWEILQNDGC